MVVAGLAKSRWLPGCCYRKWWPQRWPTLPHWPPPQLHAAAVAAGAVAAAATAAGAAAAAGPVPPTHLHLRLLKRRRALSGLRTAYRGELTLIFLKPWCHTRQRRCRHQMGRAGAASESRPSQQRRCATAVAATAEWAAAAVWRRRCWRARVAPGGAARLGGLGHYGVQPGQRPPPHSAAGPLLLREAGAGATMRELAAARLPLHAAGCRRIV